jgi:2-iminobutanoate/2-iminopropanoate deaminase
MKKAISTDQAPEAIGPYSQAMSCSGNLLFCSGQIPLDPNSGEIIGETAADQARRVLDNLKAVLEAGGSSLDAVVKTTVYLTDISEFASVNEVYGEYFAGSPPARAAVAVAALPRGARVMMEAVALTSE